MKTYQAPSVEIVLFDVEDIITESGLGGIVSESDSNGAAQTLTTGWNDAWTITGE